MIPERSLADLALAKVTDKLKSWGSSLDGDGKIAISALLATLEAGLTGSLEKVYHLSAIDPGMGKTLSVITFLSIWKENGFQPASSVLIGLSRLQEIEEYVKASGLDEDEFAVLTGDQDLNALGLPERQHQQARVMFTTQQMIERRTRDRTFAEANEFFYDGGPRTLRIWDESLTPAEGLVVAADDIARLPAMLHKDPEAANAARQLTIGAWSSKPGSAIMVPKEFEELLIPKKAGELLSSVALALSRLAGREAALVGGEGLLHLAGSSRPLPDDFAPVVILDASGRVRSTYDVWEREKGEVRRLPTAANDYDRLRVHLWERAVGQGIFRQPGTKEQVIEAVAGVINDQPERDWLIVHYKGEPIEDELRKAVSDETRGHLHFLTWGKHHGTNAFAHCTNIVLIGQITYGHGGYKALASALGVRHLEDTQGVEQELRSGEYRHNLLQALTRASVRRSVSGVASQCTAYVIASPGQQMRDLVETTFPGCTLETWTPKTPKASGRAGELIGHLEAARFDPEVRSLRKADLRAKMGMSPPNFSRLLTDDVVIAYMDQHHLYASHREISGWSRFEAYEGEGFTVDELDLEGD